MAQTISSTDKKTFIKYFLNNYQMKRRECAWILNYLLSDEKMSNKIHFVEDISGCPRGIIMSTFCSEDFSFKFIKHGIMTTDSEKAFYDIRLNKEEDLYIQLNFKDKLTNEAYGQVLEENPFVPPDENLKEKQEIIENFLEHCLTFHKKERLLEKINKALDEKDKNLFIELSNKYNQLSFHKSDVEIIKGK